MNTEPGSPGGLFSRVVQRMRPSAAVAPPAMPDRAGDKQALQTLLERKRRNDAIRLQEFAHLRMLRQRAQLGGQQGVQAQDSKPAIGSDFQASGDGQDARVAQTLRQIDAIEAQMSRQWWRGRPEAVPQASQTLLSELPSLVPSEQAPAPSSRAGAPPASVPTLGLDSIYVPSAPGAAPAVPDFPRLTETAQPDAVTAPPIDPLYEPDLEEAAILFAHGDVGGARARLLELLVQALDQPQPRMDYVGALWHALLDLYRAIGDAECFEALAIDYAAHFGRSAPLWFSMPQQLGMAPLGVATPAPAQPRGMRWAAPARMTVAAVAGLEQALEAAKAQGAPVPWLLSWRRLNDVEEAAMPRLTQLLGRWAEQPELLVWAEAEDWLQCLAAHTVVGQAEQPAAWWLLRLAVLRCLGQEERFEQVALDYCITYEVSPPAWSPPLQACVQQDEADLSGLSGLSKLSSQAGASVQAAGEGAAQVVVPPAPPEGLAGVVEGDPAHLLQFYTAQARLGEPLEIVCDQLIRMDFVAAGSVLNWAAEMQAQGHQLRFIQLHQLVAVFFRVIGIHEHAKVVARAT